MPGDRSPARAQGIDHSPTVVLVGLAPDQIRRAKPIQAHGQRSIGDAAERLAHETEAGSAAMNREDARQRPLAPAKVHQVVSTQLHIQTIRDRGDVSAQRRQHKLGPKGVSDARIRSNKPEIDERVNTVPDRHAMPARPMRQLNKLGPAPEPAKLREHRNRPAAMGQSGELIRLDKHELESRKSVIVHERA